MLQEIIRSGTVIALSAAMLVVIGFVSTFAESRVLGLPYQNEDVVSYLLRAGELLLRTLQSLNPFLVSPRPQYAQPYCWGVLLGAACLFLVSTPRYVPRLFSLLPVGARNLLQSEQALRRARYLGLFFGFATIVTMMTDYYEVRNVVGVDSWSTANWVEDTARLLGGAEDSDLYTSKFVAEYYTIRPRGSLAKAIAPEGYAESESKEILFDPITEKNATKRKRAYASTLLLVLIPTCLVAVYLGRGLPIHPRWPHSVVWVLVFLSVIAMSYVHGVVGNRYEFPVVDLVMADAKDASPRQRQGLLLLRDANQVYTLLARADYMYVYQIPKSAVLMLRQRAIVALFQNCGNRNDTVKPCESIYW